MVVVNEEFVMNEEMIKAGDIVALIPPLARGIISFSPDEVPRKCCI